jgi:Restriction endonuclease
MAKAGDEYRELVGKVMETLDPGSAVKTEQWITGPDGERDMDVEVRGTRNGIYQFIVVECKDHARPIGIGFVDAFESKIRDLKPDRAIMFSNSGFTRDALKKANRVGIEMASAMKARDNTIKIAVHREVVARRLTLTFGTVGLFPFDGDTHEILENWNVPDLLFDELPVIHWISDKMALVASEHDTASKLSFLCTFRHEPRWSYHGQPLKVGGLKFVFTVQRDWVAQTVKSEVSLGYYDHLKRSVVVPPKQWYTPGMLDNEAWEETDKKWEEGKMEPKTFRLNLTIIRSNVPSAPGQSPKVDELIAESRVDVEEVSAEPGAAADPAGM